MEYDGEAREFLHHSVEYVECEWGRNEAACLGVAGTLLGSELVCAVTGTDRDGEAVTTCAGCKVNDFFGFGIVALCVADFVLDTCEYTEFAFDCYVELVSIFNDLLGEGNVFFVWKTRAINHYAREAHVDAALAGLEAITVVEVEYDFGLFATELFSIFYCTLCHIAKEGLVGIVAGTLADLKDDGALLGYGSFDDSLKLFHVVEVECGNCIAAINCTFEHLASIHET